ncbi:MAG: hypothetical protein HN730_11585, partial [Bdellovibrionales bacterium]|nr:hypothetical protein [Bdellovibrionales bacterium]
TLTSYGDDKGKYYVPNNHMEFFNNLKVFHQTDDYFFVHAGVPDFPLDKIDSKEDRAALLWSRRTFLESKFKWDKMIIHGHTPHQDVEVTNRRVNIDTGCVFGGKLTALELPAYRFYSVNKQDRPQFIYLRDLDSRRAAIRFEGGNLLYVYRGDEVLPLEVINFSETGMLLTDSIIKSPNNLFKDQEVIGGEIGHKHGDIVQFEARVVRFDDRGDYPSYGVQFIRKPRDILFEHYSRIIRPGDDSATV